MMSPVLTFKIVSIVSLIGGIILSGVTFVTLQRTGTLNENNNSENNGTDLTLGDLADRIQSEIENATADLSALETAPEKVKDQLDQVIRLTEGLENANLTSIVQLVRANWHKLRPFLNGAEGVSLIVGLAQVIAAFVLLRTPVQSYPHPSRHFSKIWIMQYFVLGTLLIICSLIPWTFTSTSDSNKVGDFLEKLTQNQDGSLSNNNREDNNNNAELVRSLNMFYSIAGLDGALLYICGTVCHCVAKAK